MAKLARRFVGPRSSGPHRVACKALYRALLELCPQVPLPTDLPSQGVVNPVKFLIRKGFRKNQHEVSSRLTVKALKVGYNAEELLRAAASGSQAATSQIHSILHHLHTQRQQSKQPPPPPRPARPRVWPYPGAPKVLDIRPLPREKLSGKRHIPILTHATGVPFLRFKKPQSPFLSRVLRNKVKQKHRLFEAIKLLDGDQLKLATWEDDWDKSVRRQLKREGGVQAEREASRESGAWTNAVEDAREDVWDRVLQWTVKAKETAQKMAAIVNKEKELRGQEIELQNEERRARYAKLLEKKKMEKEEAGKGLHVPGVRDI